jgi:hypothetical protein
MFQGSEVQGSALPLAAELAGLIDNEAYLVPEKS